MVREHHQLNGHEFEQTLGDREGQGSLACCSPWGYKELDTTEQLNNNKHLGIKLATFPALLWVASESNYSTSKNDGITDKNKHYHKSF